MVEFDVRAWNGELVLAHTVLQPAAAGTCAWTRPSPTCAAGGWS